tara:strand:- start:431 stop:1639 length:1209 start_codon:yes stop_codon:yes gene_type:complete
LNILFLSDNFPPEVNAPATRTYEHCVRWVEQGVKVTVITCQPNFPKGKIYDGYKNRIYQKEVIEGITVIRVWSFIAPNSGFFKRILDFVSYAVMAFIVGLFQKCDLIIGTSPQFFTAVSARMLSLFKWKPWVMEVRDLWPESIAAVGALKKSSFSYKLLSKVERHLYLSADTIIPLTNAFKKYMVDLGIQENKIRVVTNGVDRSKFMAGDKDIELLRELKLEEKFVIGYIGTHGMAHALNFIVETAKEITDERIHFVLQGDGSEKFFLQERARELNLNNLTFLPFVAKDAIRRYISILDVALVNLKKSDTFKTVIPSKIFENASMLKPILLGVEGESKEIILKYNAGLCYEPENKEALKLAIKNISQSEIYKNCQGGCSDLANDYARNNLADEMLQVIEILK